MGHIDPTREVFAQFRADDRPGPIHMLNLVRLRAHAAYPDGRQATGAEAYAAYGRESGPVFERLGGRIVWQGRFELMLIGPTEERWDHCFIAEYPSVAAFAEMIRDLGLPGSGETPPGRGRGFPPDPPRGVAGRQDVWGYPEVAVALVMRGLNPRIHQDEGFSKMMDRRVKTGNDGSWRRTNRRPRGTADRLSQSNHAPSPRDRRPRESGRTVPNARR